MKNSKLIDILKSGHLVVPLFFLKNYKKLKLELDEFLFLMYLNNLGNHSLFNPQKYSEDFGFTVSDVMKYIGNLTDKNIIQVEVLKNEKGLMEEVIVLDYFYEKIALLTMEEVNKADVDQSNVFELIEKEFGRTLSPMEYEIIKAWLDNNISEELIREALKEATFNGVSNLRYIDKILYEWGKNNIKTLEDVENMRKKRNSKVNKDQDNDIDIEMVDWNWFDEDE